MNLKNQIWPRIEPPAAFAVEEKPWTERAAQRASFELCKFGVGALIAGAALTACYRAALVAVRTTDSAIHALSAKVPAGITFAPGFESAPAMETQLDAKALDALVESHAKRYNIDPDLLRGVIATESSWNPHAKPKGGTARGLGQLTATTREHLGYTEEDAIDPETGIEGAAYWLRKKIDEQGGDERRGVRSYYCGTSEAECLKARKGAQYEARVAKNYGARPPLAPAIINAKRVG